MAEFRPAFCPAAKPTAKMLINRNASESFISRFLHTAVSDIPNSYLPMQQPETGLESEFLKLTKPCHPGPQLFHREAEEREAAAEFPSRICPRRVRANEH